MILELYTCDGAYELFADTFEFAVCKRRHGIFKPSYTYCIKIYSYGWTCGIKPTLEFNKRENAEALKQYITDKFNSIYPKINIKEIEKQLRNRD